MEALAILGGVANVAQALEYGFRLLQMGKSLRRLGVIDPDLNEGISKFNSTVTSLDPQEPPRGHENLRNLTDKALPMEFAYSSLGRVAFLAEPHAHMHTCLPTQKPRWVIRPHAWPRRWLLPMPDDELS
ncbi:hypothetical protein F5X98DRAFT_304869 [Xylaria grammica]|nr:hypothetical protein F5X98DRAFT_304869 [Xylaria grammica]